MDFLTLSMENKASFVCPIFGVTTQMRSCVKLQEKLYKGKPAEVRRGCQACMTASKCPAAKLISRISFNHGNATDEVSSRTEAVVKLPADVLEDILPVIVMEAAMRRFNVSPEERTLIDSANERIAKQLETAPRNRKSAPRIQAAVLKEQAKRRTVSKAPVAVEESAINKAAATGDLSAAIN